MSVGNTIEGCILSPVDEEISDYIEKKNGYKKIIVVADSLSRVLKKLTPYSVFSIWRPDRGKAYFNTTYYGIFETDYSHRMKQLVPIGWNK